MNSLVNGMEENISVSVGVVGPAALGEEAQKFIHSLSGDPKPRGWTHQLENEPALLLHYRRSWFRTVHQSNNLEMEIGIHDNSRVFIQTNTLPALPADQELAKP